MSDIGSSLAQTILARHGRLQDAIADCDVKLREANASDNPHAIAQYQSALTELQRLAAAEEKGRFMRG